ncbi:hypothetical protein CFIMG_006421RAa [Ceratocystis fimbriata CBS 114723]|uniref:Uncharacterized protein n=2 Tax=Ceratocystis TaxID=5157 RepID=A0A2C5WUE2_9PEZI|nr:hypothetical protein CFIMG_006421RAa [Ceratocystis fimbriata CBS 114723]
MRQSVSIRPSLASQSCAVFPLNSGRHRHKHRCKYIPARLQSSLSPSSPPPPENPASSSPSSSQSQTSHKPFWPRRQPPPFSARNPHETHASIFTQLFPTRDSYRPRPPPPRVVVSDSEIEEDARRKAVEDATHAAAWEIPQSERPSVGGAGGLAGKRSDETWRELRERFPALGNRSPTFRSKYWNLQQDHLAMLIIKNTLTSLAPSDFNRIVPPGMHLPSSFWSILKVVAKRNPHTLEPNGTYYLLFPTETNAIVYREELYRLQRLYSKRPFNQPDFKPDELTTKFTVAAPNALKVSMEIVVGPQDILNRFRPGFKANLFRRKEYGIDPSGGAGGAGVDTLVQLTLHGDQMTLGRLYMLLNEDGRERGMPWGLTRQWCRNGVAFSLEDANLQGRKRTPSTANAHTTATNTAHNATPSLYPGINEGDAIFGSQPIQKNDQNEDENEEEDINRYAKGGSGAAPHELAATENPLYVGSSQFLLLFTSHIEAQRFVRAWHTRTVLFQNSRARTTNFHARVVTEVWLDEVTDAETVVPGRQGHHSQSQQPMGRLNVQQPRPVSDKDNERRKGTYSHYYKRRVVL